jgi:hypothetical protein
MSHSHTQNNNNHHRRSEEPLWKELWRPLAAYIYLAICLLDFGLMPIIYEMINHSITNASVVELALKFTDASAQIEALHTLRQAQVWVPLTLQGNGMFHVAFGAILGVSAWTRGQEKAMMQASGMYGNQPGFNTGGGFNNGFNNGGFNNFGGGNMPFNPMPVNPVQPNYNPIPPAPVPKPVNPIPVNPVPVNPAIETPKVDLVNPDDPTNE